MMDGHPAPYGSCPQLPEMDTRLSVTLDCKGNDRIQMDGWMDGKMRLMTQVLIWHGDKKHRPL